MMRVPALDFRRPAMLLLFAVVCVAVLQGQSRVDMNDQTTSGGAESSEESEADGAHSGADEGLADDVPPESEEARTVPPTGFGRIELGLGVDEVKEKLQSDSNFLYRGDPDVSLLRRPSDSLLEANGAGFVERGYFQFYQGRLYTITLELSSARLDHYTMYTTLTAKYGDPDRLNPSESVWEFDGIRMSLERPLRLKYIDTGVFEEIIAENRKTESLSRMSRDRFLDQF